MSIAIHALYPDQTSTTSCFAETTLFGGTYPQSTCHIYSELAWRSLVEPAHKGWRADCRVHCRPMPLLQPLLLSCCLFLVVNMFTENTRAQSHHHDVAFSTTRQQVFISEQCCRAEHRLCSSVVRHVCLGKCGRGRGHRRCSDEIAHAGIPSLHHALSTTVLARASILKPPLYKIKSNITNTVTHIIQVRTFLARIAGHHIGGMFLNSS